MTTPVAVTKLQKYWDKLIAASTAEEQMDAVDRFTSALSDFEDDKVFQSIHIEQQNKAVLDGLLGYVIEAAYAEDNLPAQNGKSIIRHRLERIFRRGEEAEMTMFLENWLQGQYPNRWGMYEYEGIPRNYYAFDESEGAQIQVFSFHLVKEDTKHRYPEWGKIQ